MSTKFKPYYLAGSVAAVLNIAPATLRQWRDRDICHLGSIEEGAEDNPRSRRRYSLTDIGMMAMALALVRNGFALEEAFNIATGQRVRPAIAAAVIETGDEDQILVMVGSGDLATWADALLMPKSTWREKGGAAFDASDYLDNLDAEYVRAINVSAVTRSAMKRLAALGNSADSEE
ncbi:MerR family transcriptional regulator [Rhizobium leguminosarum]|uniref:MerR family transcriptional regulator n=1 Tax=Rhizobium leguminosarum TaxID=384 RepID=UPI003F9C5AC4